MYHAVPTDELGMHMLTHRPTMTSPAWRTQEYTSKTLLFTEIGFNNLKFNFFLTITTTIVASFVFLTIPYHGAAMYLGNKTLALVSVYALGGAVVGLVARFFVLDNIVELKERLAEEENRPVHASLPMYDMPTRSSTTDAFSNLRGMFELDKPVLLPDDDETHHTRFYVKYMLVDDKMVPTQRHVVEMEYAYRLGIAKNTWVFGLAISSGLMILVAFLYYVLYASISVWVACALGLVLWLDIIVQSRYWVVNHRLLLY